MGRYSQRPAKDRRINELIHGGRAVPGFVSGASPFGELSPVREGAPSVKFIGMTRKLPKILAWLAIGAVVGVVVYSQPFNPTKDSVETLDSRSLPSPTQSVQKLSRSSASHPCNRPLGLRIGEIDPQYGITRGTLETAVNAAIEEWHASTGRKWFQLSDAGELSINLLYDGRQEALEEERAERRRLSGETSTLRARKAQYDATATELSRTFTVWKSELEGYNARVAHYNERLHTVPENGQMSGEAVVALEREREELARVLETLTEKREKIQAEIDRSEDERVALNSDVETLSEETRAFQRRFPARSFDEGEHLRGMAVHEINIYAYENPDELHLVLLHELGHAIGIKHLSAPGAVMSPVREFGSGDFHLSTSDVSAALALCSGE